MVWVMLNFNYNGEGMLNTQISEEAKSAAIEAFNKIYKTALNHLNEKKVSVAQFMVYLGIGETKYNILKLVQTLKFGSINGENSNKDTEIELDIKEGLI